MSNEITTKRNSKNLPHSFTRCFIQSYFIVFHRFHAVKNAHHLKLSSGNLLASSPPALAITKPPWLRFAANVYSKFHALERKNARRSGDCDRQMWSVGRSHRTKLSTCTPVVPNAWRRHH